MKKYLKSAVLGAAAVLLVGSYYIGSANVDSTLPQFALKHLEGDPKEADHITLKGELYFNTVSRWAPPFKNFEIKGDQTTYHKESVTDPFSSGPIITDLQDRYRGFMRGKSSNYKNFYEDQAELLYAESSDNYRLRDDNPYLTIAMLNKKNEEKREFHVPLSKPDGDSYVMVENVQRVNGYIQVIIQENLQGEASKQFIRVLKIDPKKKEVTDEQTLSAVDTSEVNSSINSNMTPNQNAIGSHPYDVLYVETGKYDEQDGTPISEERTNYMVYNANTGKFDKIKSAIAKEQMLPKLIQGSILYAVQPEKKGLKIQLYNMQENKDMAGYTIDWGENSDNNIIAIEVHNRKLIVYSKDNLGSKGALNSQPQQVLIADVKTGQTLYKGEILMKGSRQSRDYQVSVTQLLYK